MKNQKANWWLDAILFTGFIVTFLMDFTGVELHQWIGIAIGVILLVHLAFHFNWVVTVVDRFFGTLKWQARINLLIDGLLVGCFQMIILTGLLISTWFNLTLNNYHFWKTVHILSSVTTLFMLLLKIVLHRKWIVCVAGKCFCPGETKEVNPLPVQFRQTKAQVSRREFLKIGGVVGAASLVGVSQIAKLTQAFMDSPDKGRIVQTASVQKVTNGDNVPASIVQSTSGGGQPVIQPTTISTSVADQSQPIIESMTVPTTVPIAVEEQSQLAAACTVRCSKGCSFPGRCRRYTDNNGNGKCDLGECV
ncbi:MAG: twin-arginine translocation signal domain-containing protein [Leptolinea sp.]